MLMMIGNKIWNLNHFIYISCERRYGKWVVYGVTANNTYDIAYLDDEEKAKELIGEIVERVEI